MSKAIDFKLDGAGVRELLKSPEMQQECMRHANATLAAASGSSDGYVAEPRNYPERSGAAVRADTFEARLDNANNNTLLKSLR